MQPGLPAEGTPGAHCALAALTPIAQANAKINLTINGLCLRCSGW
jgi:hypothetical protein